MQELKDFKASHKTTEFIASAATYGVFLAVLPFVQQANLWAIGVTVVTCGYMVSRAIFKKNRTILIMDGEKTTELKALLAGVIGLLIAVCLGRIGLDMAALMSGVMVGTFNVARGWTKGLTPKTNKLTVLR